MSKKIKVSSVKKNKSAVIPAKKKTMSSTKKPVNEIVSKSKGKSPSDMTNRKSLVNSESNMAKAKTITKANTKPISKASSKTAGKKIIIAKKTVSKPLKASNGITSKKVGVKKQVPAETNSKVTINNSTKATKISQDPVNQVIEKLKEPKKAVKSISTEKENRVFAISNMIPKKEVVALSLTKLNSISSSITNAAKKVDSYSVKPEKEPIGKYELEFITRASAEMLYEFLATPSGLSEWFCDDVNIRNGIYTFIWDGQLQQARLLKTVEEILVRFQWVDKTDGSYFEFKIQRDDLTNDISLIITDFADNNADKESAKMLWHSQVDKLMHVIGSIF
jgi:uncharacterized protein YndB with AHSA1/START domain